jgi:hypothetical protein
MNAHVRMEQSMLGRSHWQKKTDPAGHVVIAICRFWFDPLLHLGGVQMTFGLVICQNVAISLQTAKIVAISPRTSKIVAISPQTAMIVDFSPQTDLQSAVRIHDQIQHLIGTPAQACRILSRLVGLTSVVT